MTEDTRVLYVDPHSDTGVAPAHLDARLGDAVVTTATTPDSVLAALADGGAGCVVSGYALGESDGLGLLEAVREQHPDLPVVLCTTSGDERVASEAITAGATGYVPSETDEERLDALVAEIRRAMDENVRPRKQFNRYRSIVQAMGDGVYTLDRAGNITAVNDTLPELSGYDRERLVGEHVSLLLDEEDVAQGEQLIRDLLVDDERDVGMLPMTLNTADGRRISCETRIGLLRDGEEFHGTVGVLRSIEEHEEMKAALREEKQKIEELHEVASEMEACQTEDEIFVLTVEAAESILEFDTCGVDVVEDGYIVPKVTSSGMADDGFTTLPADEGIAGKTHQNEASFVIDDIQADADARPVQSEYRSLLSVPMGDLGVFQAGSREVGAFDDEDRELAELLLSHAAEALRRVRSQEALRESEEKYRTLVEQSHDAIYIYRDDEFVFANQRATELTGYSRDELYEMAVWDLLHPDERERVRRIARERVRGNHPPHYEARIVTKGGEVRHLEFSVRVITYEGETAQLGSARDVTERKERKRELERQNERLEEFASVVSHDLRNPLNVAQGHLELAAERGDDHHFEKTANALGRMEDLVGDLLTLARQGQVVDETEPVELEPVVQQAWATVETEEASLVVEDSVDVEADEGRLRELFENLFRNAVEHAGPAPTVRVGRLAASGAERRSKPANADGGSSESDGSDQRTDRTGFYVADDGPGIPPEQRDTVFEHGHTTAADGSGLGLSIVKGIAEAHGWTVDVCEGERGGACFEIVSE
ncbi:PAS domain S-box protein [Halomicrococcus gelatinilyticus]|uniref:PAS domain S-box protein n=1 Tax=Halomicrococcus gelatinilyticus TaxID=1702103 RepID=UPI002E1268A1